MLTELEPAEFGRARSLFRGFDYSLSIHAAIEGNNPGRIFVDDPRHPRAGLALTVEGYLLAGDDHSPETRIAVARLFRERIFTGEVYVNGADSVSLAVHPETWEARLPELIPTHEVEKLERYHYVCRALHFDWRSFLPQGYTVHRVDADLLNGTSVVFSSAMREWLNVEEEWWTLDNMLARGVSFVVVHDGEVVTWCAPDCVADDRIAVGVITGRDHRRKGLAAVAVAATVEHCLSHGFRTLEWHCNARNVASWKTAEKVGFRRNREYAYYYYMCDPIDHLAERGWFVYLQGEYARAVQYYEQVFALRAENPDYYYHLTASAWAHLGNREKALQYLLSAVDHGWRQAEWTKEQSEFAILHGIPEWDAVLARMSQDAAGTE